MILWALWATVGWCAISSIMTWKFNDNPVPSSWVNLVLVVVTVFSVIELIRI